MPHVFKSQVRESGTFRLIPKMLALMAVQRQTAASKSAKPWISEQQGSVGGDPTTTFTNPSKSAHTPSFSVSLGQDASLWCCFGAGGAHGTFVEVTNEKKRRLSERKRAAVARALEAIFN